jgi:hypothetical protein
MSKAATDAYNAKFGLEEVTAADIAEPSGRYDPAYEAMKHGGNYRRCLPETISSTLILSALYTGINAYTIKVTITPVLLGVAISTFLQAGLALFMFSAIVNIESSSLSPTCGATTPLLLHMALFCFTCFPIRDLVETFGMLQWLNEIPTSETHEELEVQRMKLQGRSNFSILILRPVTGMPLGERAFYCITCLVPKLIVAIICLLAGSGAILRAANNYDLVMATVGATFIMESDDMLYKCKA